MTAEEMLNSDKSEFELLLDKYDYSFKKGDLVKGIVVGYESGGITVDIGSKTAAVVPSKEVSNLPSVDAKNAVKVGDEKEFLIIKEEDEDGQLTLSLKKVASAYSWKELEKLKDEDAVVNGEVASLVKGGVLVEVLGIRGFVPSSHLRVKDAENLVGQTLPLKILSVDAQQNNLILSNRKVVSDLQAEQRKDLFDKIQPGTVVEGEVVRLAEFGAFVDIGGIDGLLPLSQMSWRWVDHPADLLKVADKIKVEVIGIDDEKQRVSLSLKSLQPDPWIEATQILQEGQKVKGIIIRVKNFGAFVEIHPGVEALLPFKEVQEYQNATGNTLESGAEIEAHIIRFNPDDRRISLSIHESHNTETEQQG
ncbi:MAG: S1 RNA-binding domain-containing protein [bacterium]